MRKTKFVFAVSFVAMFAINAAVATAPKADNSDIGKAHGVFTELKPIDTNGADAGIAGVTYVNRAVNQAGAAAIAAEAHAAASGAYAVSAKSSADSAGNAAATAQSAADAAATAASNAANAAAQALIDAKTYADGKVSEDAPSGDAQDTTAPSYSLMLTTINDMAVSGITDVADDLADLTDSLGTAAYTDASAYATAAQGTKADTAVQTVETGSVNGTVAVDGEDVAVKGLGTAAYTDASAYATAAQGTKADTAVQTVKTGTANGTVAVDGNDVAVKGLGTAAYTDASTYATKTELSDGLAGKQVTLTGTNVKTTGTGNVVTAVSASEGTVTVTKGTTLGSLATKSTIATEDIADGAVTKVKIENGSVTTSKIYDGAVTVAKTSGLYGVIPSGSQGNTSASASIWVQ